MKMIKTLAMVAVMFVAVSTVAKAQDAQQQGGRRGGGRGGPNVVAILKDSLHVSDAVAAKADSIVKAFAEKQAPLMEAMRGGDQDARAKMTALRTEQTNAIKALLTDEQKAAYDKLVPQGGGRRGGGF